MTLLQQLNRYHVFRDVIAGRVKFKRGHIKRRRKGLRIGARNSFRFRGRKVGGGQTFPGRRRKKFRAPSRAFATFMKLRNTLSVAAALAFALALWTYRAGPQLGADCVEFNLAGLVLLALSGCRSAKWNWQ